MAVAGTCSADASRANWSFLAASRARAKISQGLMGGIWHPYRRPTFAGRDNFALSFSASRRSVFSPRNPSRFHRHQRLALPHFANCSQRPQLPVHDIPRGPRFITRTAVPPPLLVFLTSFRNRLLPDSEITPSESHFSILLGNRYPQSSSRMDIQTNKLYSLHRPASFRMWLCTGVSSDSQHNPRAANRRPVIPL